MALRRKATAVARIIPATPTELALIELEHLREIITQRLDASDLLANERFASLKLALDLQAVENSRRLEVLNGEAGRLASMQVSYIPREVFEGKTHQIEIELAELRTFKAQTQGKGFALAPFITALIACVGVVLAFFLGKT